MQPAPFVVGIDDLVNSLKNSTTIPEHPSIEAITRQESRRNLFQKIKQEMALAIRAGSELLVAMLDLDDFKQVNDRIGHDAGDVLLSTVTKNLRAVTREGDLIAHMGGDQFAMVFPSAGAPSEYQALLNRVLSACRIPISVTGFPEIRLSASVGVCIYPANDCDSDQLLKNATNAMRCAKSLGKNRYFVFDPAQHAHQQKRSDQVKQLTQGLRQGELLLYFQPKVNMRSGRVFGIEALVRWNQPNQGIRLPGEFLHLADTPELTREIGEWVIATAMVHFENWCARGLDLALSINISPDHIVDEKFVDFLRRQLLLHPKVSPSRIYLEILESAAVRDITKVSQVIDECRSIGLKVMLDDFGTGYSSLSALKHLRVDVLKIDQSFVRDMLHSPNDEAIIRSVIGLAQAFGKSTIAEGVETEAQGLKLMGMGCDAAQGYGVARPMPAENLSPWLKNWVSYPSWRSYMVHG